MDLDSLTRTMAYLVDVAVCRFDHGGKKKLAELKY